LVPKSLESLEPEIVRLITSKSEGAIASEGRLCWVEELVEDEKLLPFCHDGISNAEKGEPATDSMADPLLELFLCGRAGL